MLKIFIFILLIAAIIIWVYIKEDDVEVSDINPTVLQQFNKILRVGFYVFILGWFIFREDIFLWLFLYTVVLDLFLVSFTQKQHGLKTWWIVFLIIAIAFSALRVPTQPDSFQQWVSNNKQLYCPSGFDCVKVSTYIDEKENLVTKSEIVPITSGETNWYLLFATGNFSYKDSTGKEVHYQGINIAGWWIETTD
ncbi:hypothetical protein [Bacillus timonensis]|uniref:hypothetical protein n=1 Tax=Bacillus timonensis TaxID=1033734 RepID=UPI00028872E8|nr:hypothetical protein [Bacillus timonensis]